MYTTRVSLNSVIDTLVPIFGWTAHQRAFALSSFFYGYIATQILGGIIAGIVGGHWVTLHSYHLFKKVIEILLILSLRYKTTWCFI